MNCFNLRLNWMNKDLGLTFFNRIFKELVILATHLAWAGRLPKAQKGKEKSKMGERAQNRKKE